MEDVVSAQPFDLSSMRMPMKDAVAVVPGVAPVLVAPGVVPVPIPGVCAGAAAFEHALNRQARIIVSSVPNQINVGRFLYIVSIKEPQLNCLDKARLSKDLTNWSAFEREQDVIMLACSLISSSSSCANSQTSKYPATQPF